jgi:hypothetical protein
MIIAWLQPWPPTPATAVRDRTAFRFVQRTARAITITERPVHISRHPRSNVIIKRLENSMNPEIEWNSSKL